MKRIISILICSISLLACQHKPDGFVINGNIAGKSDGMKVLLIDENVYPHVTLDSAIIRNGKFQFKGQVDLPQMVQIIIDKTGNGEGEDMLASRFYLENSVINYSGHIDSLPTYYWSNEAVRKEPVIEGSATEDLYQQYRQETTEIRKQLTQLDKQYLEVYHRPAIDGTFNTEEGIKLVKEMNEMQKKMDIAQWNFIEKHPENVVAYDFATQNLEGMYVSLTIPQIDQLTNIIVNAWSNYPIKAEKFKAKAENAKKMALGAKYQDIELINPEGETIKLSEYVPQGKYTMLEFWASWCGPCRGEIPHLRHVYQNYKDKGFEIISISIDQQKADWDKAMKEENMVWKQLCDPKGFEGPVAKLYNISGVPTCILLDKEGRIFKTDMRGAALDAVLQELYDQNEK